MSKSYEKEELIYCWIKNSIFNNSIELIFNNDYECDFDGTDLKIKKVKTSVDFFKKDITFNAIVGQNGTGKSSIMKLLSLVLIEKKLDTVKDDFLIIFSDGSYVSNIIFNDMNNFLNRNSLKTVYASEFDSESAINMKGLERHIDTSKDSLVKLLFKNYKWPRYIFVDINMFDFKPKYIELSLFSIDVLFDKVKKIILNKLDNESNTLVEKKRYLDIINWLKNSMYVDRSNEYKIEFLYHKIIKDIDKVLEIDLEDNIDDTIRSVFYYDDINYKEDLKDFGEKLDMLNEFSGLIELKFIDNDLSNRIKLNQNLFEFDFLDENKRRYSDLSHGEKTVFSLFLHIAAIIDAHIERPTCIFLLDEADLSLHPMWQKSFINDLIKNFSRDKNFIQFILTTHSPFILSDLPTDKIIYLNKDKDKIYVDEDYTFKKKTFAANIHTLLSDSFFMGNTLMGKFAETKIKNIIKFHIELEKRVKFRTVKDMQKEDFELKKEYEEVKKEFIYIQKSIGDEYIANVIQNHIDAIERLVYGTEYTERYKEKEIRKLIEKFGEDEVSKILGIKDD